MFAPGGTLWCIYHPCSGAACDTSTCTPSQVLARVQHSQSKAEGALVHVAQQLLVACLVAAASWAGEPVARKHVCAPSVDLLTMQLLSSIGLRRSVFLS